MKFLTYIARIARDTPQNVILHRVLYAKFFDCGVSQEEYTEIDSKSVKDHVSQSVKHS
jgi:hypothetical protein